LTGQGRFIVSVILAITAVLAIIYIVPFIIYAGASALRLVDIPADTSPQRFLLGVFITKLGTAVAFVLILHLGWSGSGPGWPAYSLIWFGMFAASELGEAVSGRSRWAEALLGVLSEAIYAPAAALAAFAILNIG
jgi:hypothetical protein